MNSPLITAQPKSILLDNESVDFSQQYKRPCHKFIVIPPKPKNSKMSDDEYVLKKMDSDCDGIFDYYDNCRLVWNPKQKDRNKNGFGDVCEPTIRRKAYRT